MKNYMALPKVTRKRRVAKRVGVDKEETLQTFVDEWLSTMKIQSIRIPDKIFKYVNGNRGVDNWFRIWFNGQFGGWADNTIILPIGNGMVMGIRVELKSRDGRLHGRQVSNAKNEEWFIVRTPEEFLAIMDTVSKWAYRLKAAIANAMKEDGDAKADEGMRKDAKGQEA